MKRRIITLVLAAALALAAGCGPGSRQALQEWDFHIEVIPTNATRINVQISGPGFALIERNFDRGSDGRFGIRLQVPVGNDRLVFAQALDSNGHQLVCARVLFDVPESGVMPNVRLNLTAQQCPPNAPPVRNPLVPATAAPTGSPTPTLSPLPVTTATPTPPPTGSGVVTTVAGSSQGNADGTGTAAQFNQPKGVAVDSNGNIYVTDSGNARVRKITPAGVVSTLAGSSSNSSLNTNGTGTAVAFFNLNYVTVDKSGTLFVSADVEIRKITSSGVVSLFAGCPGGAGFVDGSTSNCGAQFSSPRGVVVDTNGVVYVSDGTKVRKISGTQVTTLAGSSSSASTDGTGTSAAFASLTGITNDSSGNIYVADGSINNIRKITSTGVVTTLAGGGFGFVDASGTSAKFFIPSGVAVDSSGNLYVADSGNSSIRKITPAGIVTTLAGAGPNSFGFADGTGTGAKLNQPTGIALDGSGNLIVADTGNNRIRKVTP